MVHHVKGFLARTTSRLSRESCPLARQRRDQRRRVRDPQICDVARDLGGRSGCRALEDLAVGDAEDLDPAETHVASNGAGRFAHH